MKLPFPFIRLLIATALLATSNIFYAAVDVLPKSGLSGAVPASSPVANKPLITPSAPTLNAKAYILIDVNSGKIIAEKIARKNYLQLA
nr:hypothetical protein [Legionella tunisiensis]